jgi:predicted amidohydrolase YtcJ
MYTINAAYTCFQETVKGSIEPGKMADLVILSDDPTRIPKDQIKNVRVLTMIVSGKIAYEAEGVSEHITRKQNEL